MTRQIEAVRFARYTVIVVGAWIYSIWLIFFEFVVVMIGWLREDNFLGWSLCHLVRQWTRW